MSVTCSQNIPRPKLLEPANRCNHLSLGMDGLLNMRICRHHLGVQVRVLCDHDLRVESCSNEYSVDATA